MRDIDFALLKEGRHIGLHPHDLSRLMREAALEIERLYVIVAAMCTYTTIDLLMTGHYGLAAISAFAAALATHGLATSIMTQ